VHLFGVAYKKDVGDVRESPALDILELLSRRGAVVSFTDPYVPRVSHGRHVLDSVPFDMAVASPHDCSVVTTDHAAFDYARVAALPLVVDTRNALRGFTGAHIFRL
jgi:UDP-N-acetyl-D-glucosamine dehydrogenase